MIALRCYDPSGVKEGGIHVWYNDQPPEFRAAIDVVLRQIGKEPTLELAPQFKRLRGACEGLTEILIDFETNGKRVHIRILGFEIDRQEFVLLTGFQKPGSTYGHACRSAHQRKEGVLKDGKRAERCRFP